MTIQECATQQIENTIKAISASLSIAKGKLRYSKRGKFKIRVVVETLWEAEGEKSVEVTDDDFLKTLEAAKTKFRETNNRCDSQFKINVFVVFPDGNYIQIPEPSWKAISA